MVCFDFQTVMAIIEATASFRHLSLAFCKVTSERILSQSLVLVIDRAVDLMALLISSVIPIHNLSSLFNLMGMVTGHAERILPMRSPFAKVVKSVAMLLRSEILHD